MEAQGVGVMAKGVIHPVLEAAMEPSNVGLQPIQYESCESRMVYPSTDIHQADAELPATLPSEAACLCLIPPTLALRATGCVYEHHAI